MGYVQFAKRSATDKNRRAKKIFLRCHREARKQKIMYYWILTHSYFGSLSIDQTPLLSLLKPPIACPFMISLLPMFKKER